MKKIRIGGVPEHFNLPWHLCIEEGKFREQNLHVEWQEYPGGTGAMNNALRKNEIDMAVILTEGIVKDISAGNPSKIVQEYVKSPLLWGIHVDAASAVKDLHELEKTKVAISRPGSGSQLMAYVNAKNQGWQLCSIDFEVVQDLDGAVEALKNNTAQYFMWEHFTTKPLVDNGTFRRIADCPTPWPCFVIAARNEFLENNPGELRALLSVINEESTHIKSKVGIEKEFSERYGQKIEDIIQWMKITEWSREQIADEELQKVQKTLFDLKLISEIRPTLEFIYNLPAN